mmetsp:Transcript_67134/g.148940  ORF Transcript_67134/g.148940 Transcript_67134/m.148940 type:complete len:141 (+) Transcript_67134:27-449(+)
MALASAQSAQSEEVLQSGSALPEATESSRSICSRQYRPTRCFLRFQLTLAPPQREPISAVVLQAAISEGLATAFGNMGSGFVQWTLVSFAESGVGILRMRPEHMPQLRFALTLLTRCGGRRCRADVLAVAPSLAALACAR